MPALSPELKQRLPSSLREYARRCIEVDTRSFAMFRIFVGVLIIADVLSRARSFGLYYTDDGLVTQEMAERRAGANAVSVFFYTEDPTIIAALFVIHVLIAIILIFGYKSRWMLALSFLFVISLDHHHPFATSYADVLFRMLLFWALFLPLGERWSIDALQRERIPRRSVASLATFAIMVQMVFMYFVNGNNKFPSNRWHSGEAAIIVMGIDEMTFLLGDTMRHIPFALQMGGRFWFYALLLSPLLILLYGRARYPLLAGMMGGHASFAITVRIGAFPYVAILGLMMFLQPRFWSDATRVAQKLHLTPVATGGYRLARRVGEPLAAGLPGRLFEFPQRDIFVRSTLTVLVAIAMIGLMIFPGFAIMAEGPYMEESPLPDDNPVEEIAGAWSVSQPAWSIFAGPGPRSGDRYYVFPAKTTDGQVIDVYNDRPMTWERPGQELQKQHNVYRERFWMNSIRRGSLASPQNQNLAQYYCDLYAEERGLELEYINMWTVRESITLDTIDDPANRTVRYDQISRHSCEANGGLSDIAPPPGHE